MGDTINNTKIIFLNVNNWRGLGLFYSPTKLLVKEKKKDSAGMSDWTTEIVLLSVLVTRVLIAFLSCATVLSAIFSTAIFCFIRKSIEWTTIPSKNNTIHPFMIDTSFST